MVNYANPRIFGFDYSQQDYNGSITVSSGSSTMWYATDNNRYTRWTTSGQSGTADLATWTRDFGIPRAIDSIFVYQSNIKNVNIHYGTGNSELPNCTVSRSADGYHSFFKFDSVSTNCFRLSGTSTLVAGDEKYINEVFITQQLGQFEYPVKFKGGVEKSQVDHKLENGRHFIINKGNALKGSLEFKSHVSGTDVTLFNTLLFRDAEFLLWLNGGHEDQFTYKFYPYRFEDFFKVSILKGAQPSYTDNYYKAGLNVKVDIIEVE